MKQYLIAFASFSSLLLIACGGSTTSTTAPVTPPIITPIPSTANEWAWTSGTPYSSSGLGQVGNYGTLGTASSSSVPGSRGSSAGLVDSGGNLWIIGGFGLDATGVAPGDLNDIWKYSPTSGQWAWEGGSNITNAASVYGTRGVTAAANIPGGRSFAARWVDTSGNLWLFGGSGDDANGKAAAFSDLWQFSPTSNRWTWEGGNQNGNIPGIYGTVGIAAASNAPGARTSSVSWEDTTGNFWMFGGYGNDSTPETIDMNDLWRLNTGTLQWTWTGGGSLGGGKGIYGTQGAPNSLNQPGARELASSWVDANGNFWLFGGYGFDATGTRAYLSDLWEFSPSTIQWTWIAGSNQTNATGNYGVQGTASITNTPGARRDAMTWKDSSGNFWLLGGIGYAASGSTGELNDLWKFNVSSKQWTWVSGGNQTNALGSYGAKSIAAAVNFPGARDGSVAVTDASGNFWLFGGYAANAQGPAGVALNDLWKYQP